MTTSDVKRLDDAQKQKMQTPYRTSSYAVDLKSMFKISDITLNKISRLKLMKK